MGLRGIIAGVVGNAIFYQITFTWVELVEAIVNFATLGFLNFNITFRYSAWRALFTINNTRALDKGKRDQHELIHKNREGIGEQMKKVDAVPVAIPIILIVALIVLSLIFGFEAASTTISLVILSILAIMTGAVVKKALRIMSEIKKLEKGQ